MPHLSSPRPHTLPSSACLPSQELLQLRETIFVSFGAVAAFFILGCIANIALLSAYMRLPRFAEPFQSDAVWRQSIKSAVIGFGATAAPAVLAAFASTTTSSATITAC